METVRWARPTDAADNDAAPLTAQQIETCALILRRVVGGGRGAGGLGGAWQ